jgi:hypothetical protein
MTHNPHRNSMTTGDLFELASLDALGLLDESERRAFEEGSAAAPRSVQSQIRSQQTRMAEIDAILPRVEPPPGLRARVLSAVAAAIEALPGRARTGESALRLLPSRGVAHALRAVAIGCAAAAIVLGVTTLQMTSMFKDLERANQVNKITELVQTYGFDFDTSLLDPNTRFVKFLPETSPAADASVKAMAVLLLDPDKHTARLYCRDLPERESYRLVTLDQKGSETGVLLASFEPSGSRTIRAISEVNLPAGCTIALTTVGSAPRTILHSSSL